MTTKTRPALTPNPSKQIEWLRELELEVPVGSYLASFLRPAAIDWFAQQAREDASCDLYGALLYEQKERTQTAANWRAEHEAAKADWKQKLEKVERDAMQAKAERVALEDRLVAVKDERDASAQAYAALSKELDDKSLDNVLLRVELDDAQVAVRDLKAKILDLLVQAGRVTL